MTAVAGAIQLRSRVECCSNARAGAKSAANQPASATFVPAFDDAAVARVPRTGLVIPSPGVDRVLSACNMQYDADVWRRDPRLGCEEAMQWLRPITGWPIPTREFSSERVKSPPG